MRLFALRGATTVAATTRGRDPRRDRRADARDHRPQRARPGRRRQLHLHAHRRPRREFPAVAARELGFDRVPLLCAREVDVPGSLPRVIRVLMHYYAAEDHARATSTSGGARAAPRPRRRASSADPASRMAIEFSERVSRIPVYPAAVGLRAARGRRAAGVQRVARAAAAAGRRGDRSGRSTGLNRYPDPTNAKLRGALSDRYGVPGRADRDRQRLVRHPARRRRGAAGARRRARLRVAVVQRLPAPRGGLGRHAASASPLNDARGARPRRDGARDHRRDAAGHRLQPQQPDVDGGAAATTIAEFVAEVPRARLRDRSTRPTASTTRSTTPTRRWTCSSKHPNLVLLRTFSKVYGLCGLRVGYALCGSDEFVTAVNQVRQPFFCNAAAQAAAIEALKHQDAVAERVERAIVARVELEAGLERARASRRPSRRPTSAGSTCRRRAPTRARSSRAWPSAACSCAPARRWAGRARCASPTARRRRTSASWRRWASCC